MEIENGARVFKVGKIVAKAPVYNLYLCETSDGRECLLQIASGVGQNGALDRNAYILRELKHCADELEKEYELAVEGKKLPLNYDLEFPELVDSFCCEEQGNRRINILAFRNVEQVGKMIPLSNIVEKDRKRVDIKTSAWILGKLLKLLVFAHSEGIAVKSLAGENILIEPDMHYVLVFDWSFSQSYPQGIPMELRTQDIAQAAKSIVAVLAGDLLKGIPDDPGGCEGFPQYADKVIRLARGSESDAKRAHSSFYELVERIWKKSFHPFTVFPL